MSCFWAINPAQAYGNNLIGYVQRDRVTVHNGSRTFVVGRIGHGRMECGQEKDQ
jgi:hypothetical protein